MAKVNLSVTKSTPCSDGSGFIVTAQRKDVTTVLTPFGVSKTGGSQETYYVKLNAQPTIMEVELELNDWKIVERPFTITDESSENFGKTISLKWLHLK